MWLAMMFRRSNPYGVHWKFILQHRLYNMTILACVARWWDEILFSSIVCDVAIFERFVIIDIIHFSHYILSTLYYSDCEWVARGGVKYG